MFKKMAVGFWLMIAVTFIFPHTGIAKDLIRLINRHSYLDSRHIYENKILTMALEKTRDNFGDFAIETTISDAQRERLFKELLKGKKLNLYVAPTQEKWEEELIPIRIPVLKGILGYRLFLIRKQDIERFSSIKSVEELKKLRVGLNRHWSTTKVMEGLDFNVVRGGAYAGLFKMLLYDRFDYFPRGVSEIFAEYESRNLLMPDLAIEPGIALYLPQPVYFFVSPMYPRLAKRIKSGLEIMLKDGSFDKLFWEYNSSNLGKADLKNRMIIAVDNPFLSPETPFERKELWFNPLKAHEN
ncbi:hypothetical protein [Maridesulfovibrio zosterae]|uniref:hypothetical protein n=1 Tax=Maridesulfovibrio zosterae TaxID=82171 RepID=UPI00041FEBCB|nr:hypothetical protein [Maridesulfovibrio zosterae]